MPQATSPQNEINASAPQNIEALGTEKKIQAKPLKHQRNIGFLMCVLALVVDRIIILRMGAV
jgi:hypothetical protein